MLKTCGKRKDAYFPWKNKKKWRANICYIATSKRQGWGDDNLTSIHITLQYPNQYSVICLPQWLIG